MEKIKKDKKRKSSLRKSFIIAVLHTVIISVILSGITIFGCLRFRKWLLPDLNEVSLNVTKTYDDGTETKMSMVMDFGKEEEQDIENEKKERESESKKEEQKSNKNKSKVQIIGNKAELQAVEENEDYVVVYFQLDTGEKIEGGTHEEETSEKTESDKQQTADEEKQPNEKNIKYSVDKVENSYEALPPKKKMAYTGATAAMVGLPLMYSIMGILICGFWFYKNKLKKPIEILVDATGNIARQDLDFTVEYQGKDEMGILCDSFEEMRQALYENNKELWRMLEERKMLQASVAHDLRNPIAIIEGYVEYLQLNLPEGKLGQQEIMNVIGNLSESAKRLECYANSMRDINNLEELEMNFSECDLQVILNEMADDFFVMAEKNDKYLKVANTVPEIKAKIDVQILYRILENVFSNALRFAKETIYINFSLENHLLTITVCDDGSGFCGQMLKMKNRYVPSMDKSGEHMGMGLVICNILSKKHGGQLKIENGDNGGACVTVTINIK